MASAWEKECVRSAESKGWTVIRGGWPDFLLIRKDELIAVEAKSHSDDLRPNQKQVIAALSAAGIRVIVKHESEKKFKHWITWVCGIYRKLPECQWPRVWREINKKHRSDFNGLGMS